MAVDPPGTLEPRLNTKEGDIMCVREVEANTITTVQTVQSAHASRRRLLMLGGVGDHPLKVGRTFPLDLPVERAGRDTR